MKDIYKDYINTSHWLSKEEIAEGERLTRVNRVIDITCRPYYSEASEIEDRCNRAGIELSDKKAVQKVADKIIRRAEAAGMLPTGQPCI